MVEKLMRELERENINVFRLVLMDRDGAFETADRLPTTPCHDCYSISKAVTATAVGILQDRGLISVSDSLERYFDLRAYDREAWRRVKVEHLLTHTMGIERGSLFEADRYTVPSEDWVDWILRQPLPYAPGQHYAYSNSTFYLLSVVVEKVAGCTLHDFLRRELFTPMGIRDYAWETCPMGHTMGATGLYLSTEDLARFCRLYLCGGLWEGDRLLSGDWCGRVHAGPEGSYYGGFTVGRNGRYFVAGAYQQFEIIAPDRGAVLAGHSFVDGDGSRYSELRDSFLDSLPET